MEVRKDLSLAVVLLGWLPIASCTAAVVAMEAPSSQAPDEALRQCAEALDGRRTDSPIFRFGELTREYFLAGHKDKDGKAKQELAKRLYAALESEARKIGSLLSAAEAAEGQVREEIERIKRADGALTPGDREKLRGFQFRLSRRAAPRGYETVSYAFEPHASRK